MANLTVDTAFLDAFERDLDPRDPERGRVKAKVLGYGEISTVIAVDTPATAQLAFKRMPMFLDAAECDAYEALYKEYVDLLTGTIGVRVVPSRTVRLGRHRGKIVVYIAQERLPADRIAQALLHKLSPTGLEALVRSALAETKKVFDFNAAHRGEVEIAIDGQISNWALRDAADLARLERGELVPLDYLDTSTPLLRKKKKEQLNTELFLRSAPSFLVWLIRLLFLKDVVGRYYDLRKVAIDIAANFYKEQLPAMVPGLVGAINAFFAGAAPDLAPISVNDVDAYYREDALIWRIYLAARKIDRALHRLLGRDYPYILPAVVKR